MFFSHLQTHVNSENLIFFFLGQKNVLDFDELMKCPEILEKHENYVNYSG